MLKNGHLLQCKGGVNNYEVIMQYYFQLWHHIIMHHVYVCGSTSLHIIILKKGMRGSRLFSRGVGVSEVYFCLPGRGGGIRGIFTGGPPNVPHPSRSAHKGFIRRLIYFSLCVSSPMSDNQNTLCFEFKDFVE